MASLALNFIELKVADGSAQPAHQLLVEPAGAKLVENPAFEAES